MFASIKTDHSAKAKIGDDGCITCPWHGFQYNPETGASPPPFTEKVPTFNVKVENGKVFVHPKPNKAGVFVEPAILTAEFAKNTE